MSYGIDSEDNQDCIAKARPGEPMFVLMGRDPDAAHIIRLWADRREAAGGDPEHIDRARAYADACERYAADPANAPNSAPAVEDYPS